MSILLSLKIKYIDLEIKILESWEAFADRIGSSFNTYGYIMVTNLFTSIRVAADIYTIWGMFHLHYRYTAIEPPEWHWQAMISGILPLWIFGLLHVCLLHSLAFAWLSFSDLSVIDRIARVRSAFEVIFATLYFLAVLGPIPLAFLNKCDFNWKNQIYGESAVAFLVALTCLIIRSFCEIIIVGQLDRSPTNLPEILDARNTTYGLFSSVFVVSVIFAIPFKGSSDPLEDARNVNNLERSQAQENARVEVRDWVMEKLLGRIEDRNSSSPPISELLCTLEKELGAPDDSADPLGAFEAKKEEISKMREYYKDWKPIYRFSTLE
ncbi:hypothetical protein BGZ60DRAFT_435012 [Tricladium varicosporioides]|nr:hypothetical protein BGZ60DRAFT_435012 [Hymenoscyphus varicosporioides]